MKDFRLSVLDKNGELKEVSPEFLKPTKVDFDMSDIESHHPTAYLGVDLAIGLDATNVQRLRKALYESKPSSIQSINVYKDYIDARAHIRRGLLTNRRICEKEVKSFVTTLRFAIGRAEREDANPSLVTLLLVHKRFGRKKKKRIKKQFGGLPLRTIIEKLFMKQLWLEGKNYSCFEHLKHSQWWIATVSADKPPSARKRLNMRQFKWK